MLVDLVEPRDEVPCPQGEDDSESPLKQRRLDMDMDNDEATADTEEMNEAQQQEYDDRFTDDYYRWKKNTPLLYDTIFTHSLAWPSLTVQWYGDAITAEGYSTHKLLLGTHCSGEEQNKLFIAEMRLPDAKYVSREVQEVRPAPAFGEETDTGMKEEGGYGEAKKVNFKVQTTLLHDGEVNCARSMPQDHFVIATKTPSANVLVFDVTKHPSEPPAGSRCRPQHICKGHKKEGYGLCWSKMQQAKLFSCGDDGLVCHWDLQQAKEGDVQPTRVWSQAHNGAAQAVDCHAAHPYLVGSCGDDGAVRVWDLRKAGEEAALAIAHAHSKEINSLAFSPLSDYLLATGASDNLVRLWDLRQTDRPLHTLAHHSDEVFQVRWHPTDRATLSSGGADSRIMIWDLEKLAGTTDADVEVVESDDQPPAALKFVHAGHTSRINDFNWHADSAHSWNVASVSEDNLLHVWEYAGAKPEVDALAKPIVMESVQEKEPIVMDADAMVVEKTEQKQAKTEAESEDVNEDRMEVVETVAKMTIKVPAPALATSSTPTPASASAPAPSPAPTQDWTTVDTSLLQVALSDLQAFFQEHNPAKLAAAAVLHKKYDGEYILKACQKKYNAMPRYTVPSTEVPDSNELEF